MARKKGNFVINANRFDPYKNFKFRVAIGSALAAVVGFGIVRKLLGTSSNVGPEADKLTPPTPTGRAPSGRRSTATRGAKARKRR